MKRKRRGNRREIELTRPLKAEFGDCGLSIERGGREVGGWGLDYLEGLKLGKFLEEAKERVYGSERDSVWFGFVYVLMHLCQAFQTWIHFLGHFELESMSTIIRISKFS